MNRNLLLLFLLTIQLAFCEKTISTHLIQEFDSHAYLISMNKDKNGVNFKMQPFTEINQAGFYQLASDISCQIKINSNDVILDLGGYKVSGSLRMKNNTHNITVKNGTISTNTIFGAAIIIPSACRNIKLENIATYNDETKKLFNEFLFRRLFLDKK